jgi:hypothetical protein
LFARLGGLGKLIRRPMRESAGGVLPRVARDVAHRWPASSRGLEGGWNGNCYKILRCGAWLARLSPRLGRFGFGPAGQGGVGDIPGARAGRGVASGRCVAARCCVKRAALCRRTHTCHGASVEVVVAVGFGCQGH